MDANKGAGPGFEALRIALALIIMLYHCTPIAYGEFDLMHSVFYPVVMALVPMFFCLSGFLITGSALRTKSIRVFLTFRALRIFPALIVEVSLSALVLGALLTTLPLSAYFTDRHFFAYFGNIIGHIKYVLPGVFLDNPLPQVVNGNLWTLQPEFYCYIIMAGLMLTTLVYSKKIFSLLFITSTATLILLNNLYGLGNPGRMFPWQVIIYYFFAGIFAFHWRSHIPIKLPLCLAAAVATYVTLPLAGWTFIAPVFITYIMVYVGMCKIPRIPLMQRGDYSYGIYLFSFPIQQTLAHTFPQLREWWMILLVGAPLTIAFAALSWHCVEKPTLKLKQRFIPKQAKRNDTPLSRAA